MKYDITKKSAPAMPNLGKGTECIKLLLSQTSFITKMHPAVYEMKNNGVKTALQRR